VKDVLKREYSQGIDIIYEVSQHCWRALTVCSGSLRTRAVRPLNRVSNIRSLCRGGTMPQIPGRDAVTDVTVLRP
jgi:hypothetical protein